MARAFGIAAARMCRLAHQSLGKVSLDVDLLLGEIVVLEKSRLAQRIDEMLLEFANLKIACDLNQKVPQIEFAVLAVEKFERGNQRGRNNQRRIGVVEGVANDESGLVLDRRREKIQICSEPGEQISG